MIKSTLLGMTAVAALAIAAPSKADWVRLGSVHVDHGRDHDRTYSEFAGPVENLTFTAKGSDMRCRNITAHYGNGQKQRVYSGVLHEGQAVDADVRGHQRRIERLTMTCSAYNRHGGELHIGADVGRFRSAWERTRFWASHFTRDLKHRMARNDRDRWVMVGRENFEGRHDREHARFGWRGHKVDRIALRPLDNDARCMRVSATFGNGHTRELDVNRHDVMERGRFTVIDLPGDERNIRRVDLSCRAVGDRDVTIEVLARS